MVLKDRKMNTSEIIQAANISEERLTKALDEQIYVMVENFWEQIQESESFSFAKKAKALSYAGNVMVSIFQDAKDSFLNISKLT